MHELPHVSLHAPGPPLSLSILSISYHFLLAILLGELPEQMSVALTLKSVGTKPCDRHHVGHLTGTASFNPHYTLSPLKLMLFSCAQEFAQRHEGANDQEHPTSNLREPKARTADKTVS